MFTAVLTLIFIAAACPVMMIVAALRNWDDEVIIEAYVLEVICILTAVVLVLIQTLA